MEDDCQEVMDWITNGMRVSDESQPGVTSQPHA